MTLDLAPLTRILEQREDEHRTELTLAISDVRALVTEIEQLRLALHECRNWAGHGHLALLDHDLRMVDQTFTEVRSCVLTALSKEATNEAIRNGGDSGAR